MCDTCQDCNCDNITLPVTAGPTGATGATGGVYVSIDAETMKNCPSGRHLYDIELIAGEVVTRVLQGRFEVRAEVTR